VEISMLTTRVATIADVLLLVGLIQELAEYEREPDAVLITEEDLIRDGFGPEPRFRGLIAEEAGQPAGYALFYGCYSTWTGPGIFLEDLYVRESFRGHGVGKALLCRVAQIARQEGARSIRLDVLDWNQPAIQFYKSLGGAYLEQWRNVLIGAEALGRLADA
jgi:GNAT superfamily N-acetyltransferase